MTHGSNQRVSRTEIDTHCQPMLVGCGGHAGFGDLQQCHGLVLLCFQCLEGATDLVAEFFNEH